MPDNRKQDNRWHRLDNTANLFPVIASKRFSNTYRIALNLDEPVEAELLQRALEKALPWFAAFRVRLRRGVFWHYLESNTATPHVREEEEYPCHYIDPKQADGFLFEVSYYGNRINLEVFHVLTDGTGALRFLQAITAQYLMLAHPAAFSDEEKATRWFAEHATNTQDGYVANYTPTKKTSFRMGRGYRLKGEKLWLDALNVTHAYIDLPGLKAYCRKQEVTVTQYIAAAIGWGMYKQLLRGTPPKHPVNIFLPVNLRGLFETETSLNFFSNIYITLDFAEPDLSFEGLLADVKKQFAEKLNREAMLEKISYTVGSGYSAPARIVPLPLKEMALRAIFEASANTSTLVLTSVGVVKPPPQFTRYITGAHVLLSIAPKEPFKVAALSYGDTLTLSFTSVLRSNALESAIIRKFSEDGLAVCVETNGVDHDTM